MRTPKNTGRLPRERTIVVDYPPNSALNPGAADIEQFTLPLGAAEGDSITLTPLATSAGVPYVGQTGAAACAWTVCVSSATEFSVICANVSAAPINRPTMRLRATFRRP